LKFRRQIAARAFILRKYPSMNKAAIAFLVLRLVSGVVRLVEAYNTEPTTTATSAPDMVGGGGTAAGLPRA
jgi:hypothetical protein